jgi:AcrR family transcriptional regulator
VTGEAAALAAPRDRVLAAFEAKAARVGIKAVVVAELATDLHMSTKTLYRLYPTKQDLVAALVREWIRVLTEEQEARINAADSPVDRIKAAAHASLEQVDRFCPTFWSDLARDYPEQHADYRHAVAAAFDRAAAWIEVALRPGVSMAVAGPLLVGSIRQAADPELCDRAGVTRRESVDTAVEIWARGAMANLSAVPAEDRATSRPSRYRARSSTTKKDRS